MKRATIVAVLLCALGPGASSASAQDELYGERADSAAAPLPVERMVVAASLGSAAGAVLGAIVGLQAPGAQEQPTLTTLVMAAGGSVLGTAAGVALGSGGRAPFRTALGSALGGILIGGGLATLTAMAFEDYEPMIFVGYAVGQGAFASIMTALIESP